MKNKNQIVTVIVPRLPPSVDGLGDYGLNLAKQMQLDFGIQTEFIVGDPAWSGDASSLAFKVAKLTSRSSKELESLLSKNLDANSSHTVILHYVGYGYAKRGSPVWLVEALDSWRKKSSQRKLITMFHELYAFGPIWTSQFWTSPLQKFLARKLGNLSDHALTSQKNYADIMKQLTNGKHSEMPVLSVFSNIGEPQVFSPFSSRKKQIVIFGSRGPKTRLYQQSIDSLLSICLKFNISDIIDIGPSSELVDPMLENVKFKKMGILPAEEISKILSESMFGVVNYPTEYIFKSGIFASYCAHGMLPIVLDQESLATNADANFIYLLIKNRNDVISLSSNQMQQIATNANSWYRTHSLKVHAQTFYQFLNPTAGLENE